MAACLATVASLLAVVPLVPPAQAATGWQAAAVSTFAGSGSAGAVDGTGTSASFFETSSMLVYGGSGFVGDGGRVRRVDLATAQVTTIAGTGQGGCSDNANPHQATLTAAWMAADSSSLYFVNPCGSGDSYLRRMSWGTGAVQTMFHTSAYGGYTGLAVVNGVLYLSTLTTINRVDTIGLTNSVVMTVAPEVGQANTSLSSLTTDGTSLFAVDSVAKRLLKIDPTGWTTTDLNVGQARTPITTAGGYVYGSTGAPHRSRSSQRQTAATALWQVPGKPATSTGSALRHGSPTLPSGATARTCMSPTCFLRWHLWPSG